MRVALDHAHRLRPAALLVGRGMMAVFFAIISSGCMRAMGGGMFTVQHDGKLGGEAPGAIGIGQPQG